MPLRHGSLLLMGLLLALPLAGRHLVGGELTYRCLGSVGPGLSRYELTLRLYRDCLPTVEYATNTPFDRRVSLHVYQAGTQIVAAVRHIPMRDSSVLDLSTSDTCFAAPTNLCYAVATYRDTVDLDQANAYYVTWSRCCRNETIQNIRQPGNQGMVFTAFIPAGTWCNRSPVFRNNLPTYICLNAPFVFDHGASDADGDSLVYTIVRPYTAGSQSVPFPLPLPPPHAEVDWENGYGLANVMNGEPGLAIHPRTGQLTVRPRQLGQYVFAIAVREYRQGQLLGEIRRDIQINVTDCPINLPPELLLPTSDLRQGDTLHFRRGESTCFDLESVDRNGAGLPADLVQVEARGTIFEPPYGATFEATAGSGRARLRVCWTPPCDTSLAIPAFFEVRSRDDNTCPAPHLVQDTVYLHVIPGQATPPPLTCLEPASQGFRVQWSPLSAAQGVGFEAYLIEGDRGTGWQRLATLTDPTTSAWLDPDGRAGTCYRLRLRRRCPGPEESPPSPALCAGQAPLPGLCQVSAEPGTTGILLSWPPYQGPDFAGYQLYRQGPGDPQPRLVWEQTEAATGQWRDTSAQPLLGAYCYQLAVVNGCGTVRLAPVFCLPVLRAAAAEPLAHLDWPAPAMGTHTPVAIEVWTGDSLSGWTLQTTLAPDSRRWSETVPIDAAVPRCYRLRVPVADSLCPEVASWSPPACISLPVRVFFPNAFSPNGDGINDTWQPQGAFLSAYELQVFNRWGTLLYRASQPALGWDGRYRGQPVPEGVYTFVCRARGADGALFSRQGTILLFR